MEINFIKICVMVVMGLLFPLLAPPDSLAQKAPAGKQGTLYGKVAVIMKNGDVKPVAKRLFYLLPFSLYERNLEIMKEVEKEMGPEPKSDNPKDPKSFDRWVEHIKKSHALRSQRLEVEVQKNRDQGKYAEFKTDFDGSYSVEVPAGSWYLGEAPVRGFGVEVGKSSIQWNLQVKINPGQKLKLDLSNDNAYSIHDLP